MINQLPHDQWWSNRVLFRTEVGSTAHGTGNPTQEDYDEIAVVSEPASSLSGLKSVPETVVYRPGRTATERSGPGDWDLTVYTARKWCRLAAAGNPSILVSLFGPRIQADNLGLALLNNERMFWSQEARWRFLGYMKAQRERMLGIRGGKHTNRPELVSKHGYDTKYAMHMLRLGIQGVEYMLTGKLTLPIQGEIGDVLREVRKGLHTKEFVIAYATALEEQLTHIISDAPPQPDYAAINRWLYKVAKKEFE